MGDYPKKRRPDNIRPREIPAKEPVIINDFYVHCRACVMAGRPSNVLSVRYTKWEVVVDCHGCGTEVARFQIK